MLASVSYSQLVIPNTSLVGFDATSLSDCYVMFRRKHGIHAQVVTFSC